MKVHLEVVGATTVYSGGMLKGNVVVNCAKPGKFRGVDVSFKGKI